MLRISLIAITLFAIASVLSGPVLVSTAYAAPSLTKTDLLGGWISATEGKETCSEVSASADVAGAPNIDIGIEGEVIKLSAVEYSADYQLIRSRIAPGQAMVFDLAGVGYDLGFTTRIRAVWFLRTNSRNQIVLSQIEWVESVQGDDGDMPKFDPDPIPHSAVFVKCRG